MPVIVVGVDGSAPSKSALRWAADQASLTEAVLVAVTAWEYPALYGWGPTYPYQDFEATAGRVLAHAVGEVLGADPPVRLRRAVVAGRPAQALLDAGRCADLLVVGARGHGRIAGALLGSVSQYCAYHARCPVVIVHADRPG
jgi:nucleotide-binding universal stress UspA family protein